MADLVEAVQQLIHCPLVVQEFQAKAIMVELTQDKFLHLGVAVVVVQAQLAAPLVQMVRAVTEQLLLLLALP
jgi:hypothetical protein